MDQDAFRQTYRDINPCFCLYEKSVLTHRCGCSQANRFCIAEREGVECLSESAQQQCFEFLEILREKARFTLKMTHEGSNLAHGKAIRLQVGGLRGLHVLLHPDKPAPEVIRDAHATITACRKRFGSLEEIPYTEVIRQVAAFRDKRRKRPRDTGPSNDD